MTAPYKDPLEEPSLPVPEQDLRDHRLSRISARAFELYEARGGEHGLALDDWLRAEREIDAEIGELNRHDEDED